MLDWSWWIIGAEKPKDKESFDSRNVSIQKDISKTNDFKSFVTIRDNDDQWLF